MSARVRFEDEADAEYREAGRWYESRRVGLGVEFFDAVDTTLRQCVYFPGAGTPVPQVPKDLPVRRMAVKRFPYHIVYLETPAAIRVLAIAHDRRKPGYGEAVSDSRCVVVFVSPTIAFQPRRLNDPAGRRRLQALVGRCLRTSQPRCCTSQKCDDFVLV